MSTPGELAAAASKLEGKVEELKGDVQILLERSSAPDRLKKQKELLTKARALRQIGTKLRQRAAGDAELEARLNRTEVRLTDLASSLEPDEVEEAYLISAKRGSIVTVNESNEEDDDEEDDDDDDDDEDDDDDVDDEEDENEDDVDIKDEETHVKYPMNKENGRELTSEDEENSFVRAFQAISDFHPEQKGDMELKEGEIVRILSVRPDGWWEAENEKGDRGMIPSTFVTDVDPEKAEQLRRNASGLEEKLGRGWSNVRSVVKSGTQKNSATPKKSPDVTSILRTMGAVPSGFRNSTLAELASLKDHSYAKFLFPALSESGLGFKDVKWDAAAEGIKASVTWVMRTLTLSQCKNVPSPGAGVEVLSRCARLCLFDGEKFLSNVHTVAAELVKPAGCVRGDFLDPSLWAFRSRSTPSSPSSICDCPEVFLRTSEMNKGVGILIELSLSYERTASGEKGQLSCGWIHLPFLESDGAQLPSRNYEVALKGGTPFESGVDLDSSIVSTDHNISTSKWKSMITRSKVPTIVFRMGVPTAAVKEQMSLLPLTLIGASTHISLFVMYRQILADHLIRFRINSESAELLHDPFVRFFLLASSSHALLEATNTAWTESQKKLTRAEKRDADFVKRAFEHAFLSIAAPVLMQEPLGEESSHLSAIFEVSSLISTARSTTPSAVISPAVALLCPAFTFKPFDVRDVAIDLFRSPL